jgi:Domain of unknown function (DUF5658)
MHTENEEVTSKMARKEILFFSAILLLGFLDWLTTVSGVMFFGAVEANPLIAGLTQSSMLLFSATKLTAVIITGLAFYKAIALSRPANKGWHFTNNFVSGGGIMIVIMLTVVVANNLSVICKI